jgi:RNA polymerase sigma factor (TIGR02999 family)
MSSTSANDLTAMLRAAQAGDREAGKQLLVQVYNELRKVAQKKMARLPPGQTLAPTALVHEAYLRLLGKQALSLESRRQFFLTAAGAMRDILVERARSKAGPKRGGNRKRVELTDAVALSEPQPAEVLALHEALEELEQADPVKAQIVHLRYFTGMSVNETAQVLGLSERTTHRHWQFVKAWLKNRLDASTDSQ